MSDTVVRIDMEPLVEKFQPQSAESWRTGNDIKPHPNDAPQLKEVWRICEELLNKENINVQEFGEDVKIFAPKKVRKYVEGSEEPELELVHMTDEEKVSKLKKLCKLQIEHFVKYRDILPEIQDLLKVEDLKLVIVEDFLSDSSDKENIDTDEGSNEIRINIQILKRASKAKVKVLKQKFLKEYVDRLPQKPLVKSPKAKKQVNAEVVKKHGFADLSAQELEAKRSMKKCYFKHKLWPCRKCSGCIRPDCGVCMYCKDKSKFGGHNILKQKCIHKKCSNPVVRSCERCTWNL